MKAGIAAGITLVGALASCGTMAADDVLRTGNDFITPCKDYIREGGLTPDQSFNAGMCAGVIKGVRMSLFYLGITTPQMSTACIPASITDGQITRIFLKFLDNYPEQLHNDATVLLITSLKAAFPCK